MASVTYMAWPENVRMSYHISRIIGLCDFGAADFTEIYQAVIRIDPNDDVSWNREWLRMAQRVEVMGEEAGRVFAAAFYRALAFGRSVQSAFELGINELKLVGLREDYDIPKLLIRDGVDPEVRLVTDTSE